MVNYIGFKHKHLSSNTFSHHVEEWLDVSGQLISSLLSDHLYDDISSEEDVLTVSEVTCWIQRSVSRDR